MFYNLSIRYTNNFQASNCEAGWSKTAELRELVRATDSLLCMHTTSTPSALSCLRPSAWGTACVCRSTTRRHRSTCRARRAVDAAVLRVAARLREWRRAFGKLLLRQHDPLLTRPSGMLWQWCGRLLGRLISPRRLHREAPCDDDYSRCYN